MIKHTTPDTASQRRATLRAVLNPGLVIAPGVFDGISARLTDRMGFTALYMTGYGTVASAFGLPYTQMEERARTIAGITSTPLIAHADTGYGGLLNVQCTVRGYEAAGICAIQLEDQEFPKKCGHMLGRRVVPVGDMIAKVRVAMEKAFAGLKEKRSSAEPAVPVHEFQAMSRLMGFGDVSAFDRKYRGE
ncbi:MAG: oxaloacetate decarboxylase [Burkholderiales bacterium]